MDSSVLFDCMGYRWPAQVIPPENAPKALKEAGAEHVLLYFYGDHTLG